AAPQDGQANLDDGDDGVGRPESERGGCRQAAWDHDHDAVCLCQRRRVGEGGGASHH
ncbi:MAG: hypothetical protein HOP36_03995, partial [Methyloglobulus sp.]|nr:hypothetical protein [Methyloglobulus sp.]